MDSVRVIRASEIPAAASAASTDGWSRRIIDVDEGIAVNVARNAPRASSGWHHHGENVGCVYVERGPARIEWGPDGRDAVELTAGDFYVIDPETIHRESNPGSAEHSLIAFAVGRGRKFLNADGPAPAGRPARVDGGVRAVRATEVPAGPQTTGMAREVTDVSETVSVGRARAAPGTISGWHHHGDHTTCVYVVRGKTRVEWGPGGREHADLRAGDVYIIYPYAIHREGNPGPDEQVIAGFYVGRGDQVENVVGAEAG